MTNERWLKWAIARYYRSHGYRVSMRPARAGNALVDGLAVGPETLRSDSGRLRLVISLAIILVLTTALSAVRAQELPNAENLIAYTEAVFLGKQATRNSWDFR